MPPIPIHKDAPIKPTVDGVTPKTADADTPAPTRTIPAAVPATTTASADGPPAPQPGARPVAPTASPYTPSPSHSTHPNPAPPQPGATPGLAPTSNYTATHTTTYTQLNAPPPQLSIPPPTDTQLAGRSTSSTTSATSASKPGPTTLNLGLAAPSPFQPQHTDGALEHPPGYVQAPHHLPSGGGLTDADMAAGGGNAGAGGAGGDGSVGGAAWNMLSKAGEALKKGEEAVWKAVRDK